MKILKCELSNFMSFKSAEVFFKEDDIVLITGHNRDSSANKSNGSGKSTLVVESLLWGLFGKTARGVTSDEVIWRSSLDKESKAVVKIYFTNNENQTCCVERTQDLRGQKVRYLVNDTEVTQKDKTRTQAFINQTLGFDYDFALQAIILGQGSLKFANVSDSEKKDIFSKILDLDKFGKCQEIAKEMRDKLKTESSNLALKVDYYRKSIEATILRIKDYEEKHKAFEESLVRKEQDRKRQYEEKLKSIPDLAILEGNLIYLKGEFSSLPQIDSSISLEKSKVESEISDVVLNLRVNMEHKMRMDKEIEGVMHKEVCPTCKRPFSEEDIQRTVQDLVEKRDKYNAEFGVLSDKLSVLKTSLEKMTDTYTLYTENDKKKEKITQDVRFAEMALKNAKSQVDMLKNSYASSIVEKSPYIELIEKEKRDKDKMAEDVKDVESKRLAIFSDLKYAEFWVEGFSQRGIESYLLDVATPYLNQRSNLYSKILSDGESDISFTTQKKLKSGEMREDFQVVVKNKCGASVYRGLSEGERQRVDVCIALALQDLVRLRKDVDLNISVFDEICTHMDDEGANRVMDLLKFLKKDRKSSIFFITHKNELKPLFDHVINVLKDGNVSRVE